MNFAGIDLSANQDRLERGRMVLFRTEMAWRKQPRARLPSYRPWGTLLFFIDHTQTDSRGRHAGWTTTQDCVKAANVAYTEDRQPLCTVAHMQAVIDHCVDEGLLTVKHCDTDGQVQQYFKTTPDYDHLRAYMEEGILQYCAGGVRENPAERWWMDALKGEFRPDGRISKAKERYTSIIERFYKGLRVKERLWAEEFDMVRFTNTVIPFMMSLKRVEDNQRIPTGVSIDEIHFNIMRSTNRNTPARLSRTEVEAITKDAHDSGFLSAIRSDPNTSATRYRITEEYYDFLLAIGGVVTFDNLLMVAGQDPRFGDLLKEIAAGKR